MQRTPATRQGDATAGSAGLAERLTLYIIAVFCLINLILEHPVPMAIAP